jgi:peptide-methionine (S)-S-oxide reductase
MLKMKQIFIIVSLIIVNLTVMGQNTEKITLGMGCFWCGEAVYSRIDGVMSVESGYTGGHVENPTYREVTQGTTGHAEVIQVTFNPDIISFSDILSIFWEMHNPTTLNRQGADVGTQYRSAIFYHTEAQKRIAEAQIELLTKEKYFDDPIVTEVTKFEKFCPAEDYHQDFYDNNKNNGYCRFVIEPKLKKLQKLFDDQIK